MTYGSLAQEEFQTSKRSSLYFMVPKEDHQYLGIIQLLHHFRWTWIGIFTMDNNNGECFFYRKCSPYFHKMEFGSQDNVEKSTLSVTDQPLVQCPRLDPAALINFFNLSLQKSFVFNTRFFQFLFCSPGYWKKEAEGKQFCCYDCVPCPEGKISNQKDMDDYFQCSEVHYLNKEKKRCILKLL
ncbi:hypothetical protein E2320_003564, partial [Naja naja]